MTSVWDSTLWRLDIFRYDYIMRQSPTPPLLRPAGKWVYWKNGGKGSHIYNLIKMYLGLCCGIEGRGGGGERRGGIGVAYFIVVNNLGGMTIEPLGNMAFG